MKSELLQEAVILGVEVLSLAALSMLAFSIRTRKEIGKLHNWTCTANGCDDGTGKPKSFANGFMVFGSHIATHDKTSPLYDKVSSGTILCIEHEIAHHEALLHLAQQHHNTDAIRFNVAALNKLKSVDWRTVHYRKDPKAFTS